jgi:hypothetical protein
MEFGNEECVRSPNFGVELLWGMSSQADTSLTSAEFASLKEVSVGLMARKIPVEHREKLIRLGLIEQKLGGPMLTAQGKMRLTRNT